jgi:hypothetical protein
MLSDHIKQADLKKALKMSNKNIFGPKLLYNLRRFGRCKIWKKNSRPQVSN